MNNTIDVICQHCRDGSIIPFKIRLQDDEHVYQTYNIRSYKETSAPKVTLPNEAIVTSNIKRFDCTIEVFGTAKRIVLHYNKAQTTWNIYY